MTVQYRFDSFLLNPATRELHEAGSLVVLPARAFDCLAYLIEHRDRAVGRDELIAAVWGRTEISEALLSHTVVKIRRALGDTGNEQRTIRTVPRFGYRWAGAVEDAGIGADAYVPSAAVTGTQARDDARATPLEDATPAAATLPHPASRVRVSPRALASAAVFLLVAVVLVFAVRRLPAPASAPAAPVAVGASATPSLAQAVPTAAPALVLPAEVAAPGEWRWLRLAVMDLVATRLRDGALPTLSSESVVGLLAGREGAAGVDLLDDHDLARVATLRVLPQVRLQDSRWHVRLEAHGMQRSAEADGEGADAIQAARIAADQLLRKLGRVPALPGAPPSSPELEELMQRSGAAMLADQLDRARALVAAAPEALQREPRVQERLAQLDLRAGAYAAVETRLHAALDRASDPPEPALRARMLITLAAADLRANRPDKAAALYGEAIALRAGAHDPEALGVAHLGRGAVLALGEHYDAALSEFAHARIALESAGDALGVASVDVNLGDLQLQRRRAADARATLAEAASEFERLGAREGRAHALVQLARAQAELLDPAAALATTDLFWPPESHTSNLRLRWTLAAARAAALAAAGRVAAARELAGRVLDETDPKADALPRAQAQALQARLAERAGDVAAATQHATDAMLPVLRQGDPATWMRTALLRVRMPGKDDGGGEAARELHACADDGDDGCRLYAGLADAAMASAAGHREAALEAYAAAMRVAEHLDVPEDLVAAAEPAVDALVGASQLDSAREVAGRVAPWADRDARAARVQSVLFHALGDEDAARKADAVIARLAAPAPDS